MRCYVHNDLGGSEIDKRKVAWSDIFEKNNLFSSCPQRVVKMQIDEDVKAEKS